VARLEETVEDYAEVERERDELRGLVKELREEVEGLSRVEKEGPPPVSRYIPGIQPHSGSRGDRG